MIRAERIVTVALILGLAALAGLNWRRAALFQANNDELRGKVVALEAEVAETGRSADAATKEIEGLKLRSAELMKLRNEVTQLRGSSQAAQAAAAENQRLKAELQRRGSELAAAGQTQPANTGEQFPRESWRFAGYATPENTLVSAIWAMREGNAESYLASLSPKEQERTAQNWQSMSAEQVAAQHKTAVANITGMRILEKQTASPNELLMSVYLEGPGRMERVRLNQVGGEWKFSGFVREPQGAPPAP